ncbi:MAG: glycine/betaine ABC transporter substrate-binding protein [Deltaproteobacteria bacterium]|nr:glycine/betaine ABC transporter substrate-binding protein [Deltaproteobacteria bacterium]
MSHCRELFGINGVKILLRVKSLLCGLIVSSLCLMVIPTHGVSEKRIIIGGKNFAEQYILSEMAKILLEDNGFSVILRTGVGSTVARQSLENDQIDMYYEYTGTAYTVYHKQKERKIMTHKEKCYEWVKNADRKKGISWLDKVAFNNTYTLMMRKNHAEKLGIVSISDLSRYMNDHQGKLVIGVNAEFWERPDGFKPLMKFYGFRIPYDKVKKMDSGLVYMALKQKQVDVSMGFATDGRISAFGFITLEDDKSYFPMYNPAPVIRRNLLNRWPEIQDILKPVAENLTNQEIRKLNAAVDIEHKRIHDVSRDWLKEKGMIK